MLGDDIDALPDQRASLLGFLARIEPAVDIDHLHGRIRIHLARRDRERVDAHPHLGDRDRAHIGQLVALGHHPRDGAAHRAALVELRVVERQVRQALIARRPLELHVRELPGHLQHGIAEAEARPIDQLVPLLGQLTEHALAVRALGDIGHHRGFHLVLADRLEHLLAAAIVPVVPAIVVGRADQHEADLELFLRKGARSQQRQRRCGAADLDHRSSVEIRHRSLLCDVSRLFLRHAQPVATNGLPRHAGAEILLSRRSEMSTSTRTVAR